MTPTAPQTSPVHDERRGPAPTAPPSSVPARPDLPRASSPVRDGRPTTAGGTGAIAVGIGDVLAAREARAARQRALSAAFGCDVPDREGRRTMSLIGVTLVVPGPVKAPPWSTTVFDAAHAAVRDAIAPVLHDESHRGPTGPEALLVAALDPEETKRRLVQIEETHRWGRLFDLDVVVDETPLSRTTIGAPPRRCLVGDGPAAPCARSRRHDLDALATAVRELLA